MPLVGVVVRNDFAAFVEEASLCRWLVVEVTTLDPDRATAVIGDRCGHGTTIVVDLPTALASRGLVDYEVASAPTGSASGWIEGMGPRFMAIGACRPSGVSRDLRFSIRLDGIDCRFVTLRRASRDGPYTMKTLDLWQSIDRLLGPGRRTRPAELALAVVDPAAGTSREFYGETVYATSAARLKAGEVRVVHAIHRPDWGVPGLEVWLEGEKPGRLYYLVEYAEASGEVGRAVAYNLGHGLFRAFFRGVHHYGSLRQITVR